MWESAGRVLPLEATVWPQPPRLCQLREGSQFAGSYCSPAKRASQPLFTRLFDA